MSGLERVRDFLRWLNEIEVNLARPRPPSTALGVDDETPVLYRRIGDRYEVERQANAGDAAPLYLSKNQALDTTVNVKGEAALFGMPAARIEATRASPFPLEIGASALAAAPDAWTNGAAWRLIAAPKSRIETMRAAVSSAGARPGPAFGVVDGAPIWLARSRRPRILLIAAFVSLAAAIGAAGSIYYKAAALEEAAAARLAEARQTLTRAEADAADAAARREAATSPLRQAQIVGAVLKQAPSVAVQLADLTAATPDEAYLKRLAIAPGLLTAEFIAPDAAALATEIGAAPGFTSARLKSPARTDAAGLQRATLDITPEDAR